MKKVVLLICSLCLAWSVSAQENSADTLRLTLEQALQIALSENPTIKVADKEIKIQRYVKQQTYAALYPQIDASAQYQRVIEKQCMSMNFGGAAQTIKVGSDNSFNGGITAQMPLINVQLWENLKVSKLGVELAVEKARGSKIDMVESVTKAYYSVLLAKQTYRVYKSVFDNAVENNKIIKQKYDVGSVSEYDLIRSNVTVQNAIPNMIDAENSITLTLWQLKALIGVDLSRNIDTIGSLDDYEGAMEYAGYIQNINLDKNSSMRQLDIQSEQLRRAVRITKYANIPTISLNAAYLYTALGDDGNFFKRQAWNPYSYAGVNLSIPIFAGNARRAKTRQARLDLENIALQKENTERMLRVSVVQSLNNMQNYIKQYSSANATIDQARRGYDIAVKRYEIGSGTLVDIDNSQLALTQSELTRNMAIYNFLSSKITLDKTLGDVPEVADTMDNK